MKVYISKVKKNRILPWISLIILWFVLSLVVDNDVIVPGIGLTFKNLFRIIGSKDFVITILWTFGRTIVVFLVSTLLAVFLAGFSSVSKLFYSHIKPIMSLLASVPILALILLALIWLHVEMVSIFVGVIYILPLQFENILNGIQTVDKKLLEMSRAYGVGKLAKIQDIYIPTIIISLSSIANSTLGSALKMVIAGEVLSQVRYSVGGNLVLEKTYLNTGGVFAWIIVILLMSNALSLLIHWWKKKSFLLDWM